MWGFDWLAAGKYPDIIAREHPRKWPAGGFTDPRLSFGNAWPIFTKLASEGVPLLRFQACWQDNHKYVRERDWPVIQETIRKAKALKLEFPGCDVRVSPFCEHELRGAELTNLLKETLHACGPMIKVVNSPEKTKGGYVRMDGVINEVHGSGALPTGEYQHSYDGLPCVDVDIEMFKKKYARAEVDFLWTSQCNGRKDVHDTTPRPDRKAWPTSPLVDGMIYIARNAKGKAKLVEKSLWKAFSEKNVPVLITPAKIAFYELLADNGQVIARSKSAQTFSDGRYRYYWPNTGLELAEKAIRIQGHPICKVRGQGSALGRVNPAFRENEYRNTDKD